MPPAPASQAKVVCPACGRELGSLAAFRSHWTHKHQGEHKPYIIHLDLALAAGKVLAVLFFSDSLNLILIFQLCCA